MINTTNIDYSDYLVGGGEMGDRIRSFDWSITGLGRIEVWPQSLKTAVNIVLQSPLPMVMLWGLDGIMLYNDAYSVFAGGRHPFLLGSKVVEGWPEVADFNRNVMATVLSGATLSYHDQQLTLYRNNVPEAIWMNLNYSAIIDESGKPAGVLAVVVETTERVLAEQQQREANESLKESEQRFRTISDNSPMFIYMVGDNAQVTFWNKTWLEYTGFSFEESIDHRWESIIHPDDLVTTRNEYRASFEARRPFTFENRFKKKNGNYHWILWKGLPRYLSNGEFAGFIGVGVDIQDRKQAEEALRDSEAKLTAILSQLVEGVIIADAHGTLMFINEAASRMHGVAQLGVTPDHYSEVYQLFTEDGQPYPPDDLPLARAVIQNQTVINERWRIRRPDGVEIMAAGSARPVYGPDGVKIGAVLTLRDETERVAAEESLRAYRERLERSNRELEQFATITSHDLQEPLRKVRMFGDMLNEHVSPEGREYLARMHGATSRMQTLINDLLTLSRVNRKERQLNNVDLNAIIKMVMDDLQVAVQDSQAEIIVGPLGTIQADESQIQQLFQNLMANALKYRRAEHAPTVEIFGELVAEGRDYRITVQDNGIGIKDIYSERIFEPFQRLHGIGKYPGTGMGLAICKKIVERHHGKIWMESAPNSGTRFVVQLPIKQDPQESSWH